MKKSLIYSLPVLTTIACGEPFTTTIEETNCLSYPHQKAAQPYYDFLLHNDKVTEAIGFCEHPVELQEIVWNKIAEAEETGLAPDAPLPQSYVDLGLDTKKRAAAFDHEKYQKIERVINETEYDFYFAISVGQIDEATINNAVDMFTQNYQEPVKTIYATKEEAHEIYAAHLAHSLWLEKNQLVPWSILEYSQEQLEDLLQPRAWFKTWDKEKKEYSLHSLLDHSPREVFDLLKEHLPSPAEQSSTMGEIIKSTRPFRHTVVNLDAEGNVISSDPADIITIKNMSEEKIARSGCHSMAPYIVHLANAYNIPGKVIKGYYVSAGHSSAAFEFTDYVLAHGDDVYGYSHLGNTPAAELMDSYVFWEEHVFTAPKGISRGHNSMAHNWENKMKYPAYGLINDYCRKGRQYLDEDILHHQFGPFATVEEVDALEIKLLELSDNCTEPYPENNPDQ